MKIAIVQPGNPIEIVSNLQSKRKTQTCIAFYKNERLFGGDGFALQGRKPELSISKFNRLIGRSIDNPVVKQINEHYFPYEIYRNETTGLTSLKVEEASYTGEELMAMMLQHAKQLAYNHGGVKVKDCVITIPSSYTQHERLAVYTSAAIADLKVLSLIEENTAAALHYAIDRSFDNNTIVLYYNLGATNLQVTIVQYTSVPSKDGKSKPTNHVEVLGKAWDESLGGFHFDVKLAELLAQRFNEIWLKKRGDKSGDVREHYRPMTRLRLEANKIKEVLSANNEFPVKAEQLFDDVDLITKITRADYEESISNLLSQLLIPIERALVNANISLSDLSTVELLGGSVRVPRVKKILEDYFKPSGVEIGQHLNGDESMAMGAAFRAANVSTMFKVKKIGLTESLSFNIAVKLENLPDENQSSKGLFGNLFGSSKPKENEIVDSDEVWSKQTIVYPVKSAIPGKTKTVAFPHNKDIACRLEYDESSDLPTGTNPLIAEYNITGIAEFAKETASKGLGVPKIHLSFGLDASGIVTLLKAEATVELIDNTTIPLTIDANNQTDSQVDNQKDSQADSKIDSKVDNQTDSQPDNKADNQTDSKIENQQNTTTNQSNNKTTNKKKVDNQLKRLLVIKTNSLTINSLSTPTGSSAATGSTVSISTGSSYGSLILESKAKLAYLDLLDNQRQAKEAALNELEAYLYSIRNKFTDEDLVKSYDPISTIEQRTAVIDLSNQIEDWLYGDGRDEGVDSYKKQLDSIKKLAEPIILRANEHSARPEALKKINKQINELVKKIDQWKVEKPHITEDEIEKLNQSIDKLKKWIEDKEKLQQSTSPFDPPVYLSTDLPNQLKPVFLQFDKLNKKPKPAPEKVQVNATANATSTNQSNDTNTSIPTPEVNETSSEPTKEEL
eukprot:CAMPEP_0196761474 /NCGR_PEP_ID=MMETSP1095-20130614/726_1 /TAXON_ID=96789 ORGANISM="Chromulina nebulosa, Strain UTEXLB2642" /NCGR_SAMPLE_ID=MMETSP1095 /ASSEMBLY_ACC=CAM_ASM_000446 /LENGTH=901 /DNA_ID=CAMNT_0042111073 /DNA_START=170 /DNA_END=2875 /DNA_ORIENTATION=-